VDSLSRHVETESLRGLDAAAATPQALAVTGDTTRAWLDWWANSSTRLGSAEVRLDVGSMDAGGGARARLTDESIAAVEEFEFLCALDPIFSLRFDDGTLVAVRVDATDDRREVTLQEQDGAPAWTSASRLDL
jgi:hypothetical protein